MPADPFARDGDPWAPRNPARSVEPPAIPQQERAIEDLQFWDDKEIVAAQTVGETRYVRAFLRDGSDREGLWATRESGQVEPVVAPNSELSVSAAWDAVTAPDAPTELGAQIEHEEQLQQEPPAMDDREIEIDQLLQEHPLQLEMAREELESGALDQAGYDERVAELDAYKAQLEDELKTYDMERGEAETHGPVLERYAQELTEAGITGGELAQNDWSEPLLKDPPALTGEELAEAVRSAGQAVDERLDRDRAQETDEAERSRRDEPQVMREAEIESPSVERTDPGDGYEIG